MKIKISLTVVFLAAMLLIGSFAQAGEWRFPVGLSYVSGFHKVTNVFKDNLRADGYTVGDSTEVPVGLTFQPYYMFDFGPYFGLGIGAGFGPFMYLRAESESSGVSYDMYNMPVNVSLRYIFLPKKDITPYLRTGLSYNIAGGDFVQGKGVGFVGGIGVDFLRSKKVSFGLEVAYDSSEIKLEKKNTPLPSTTKKVRPSELVVSLYALF
jgi:outer membrane protein W